MQAEPIEVDGTPRGSIHTFFYPVSYVQVFRPCSWTQLHDYMSEGDRFRECMNERAQWLVENHIRYRMRHEMVVDDPNRPHHYRLFIEFSRMPDAEAYIERWTQWAEELSTILISKVLGSK